jgi:hypothetical protein
MSMARRKKHDQRMADQAEQVSTTGLVDTKQQPGPTKRRPYSEALKRQMVAEMQRREHRCRWWRDVMM